MIFKIIQARKEDIYASGYTEKLLRNIKVEQIGSGFKEVSGYLERRTNSKRDHEDQERYVKEIELSTRDL